MKLVERENHTRKREGEKEYGSFPVPSDSLVFVRILFYFQQKEDVLSKEEVTRPLILSKCNQLCFPHPMKWPTRPLASKSSSLLLSCLSVVQTDFPVEKVISHSYLGKSRWRREGRRKGRKGWERVKHIRYPVWYETKWQTPQNVYGIRPWLLDLDQE